MKRLTYALLIAALSTTMIWQVASAQTERARDRERFCRYGSLENPGARTWSDLEVRKTIACATDRWDVAFDTALYIAERESGLHERAVNTSSGACGVFQHIPRYWPGRVAHFDNVAPRWNASPQCFNPRSNVLVSVKMMAAGGFGPWGG